MKFCFESPRSIGENEEVKVVLSPKNGMPTATTLITNSIIISKRIYLYP